MARNLFGNSGVMDVLAAGQQGREDTDATIKGIMDRRTQFQAGRAYAGGDRQGAANMLAQGGNIDGARVIQGDLRTEQRQTMQDQQAAEQQTYQRGRDAEADKNANAERNYTTLKRITEGLRTVPMGQRRAALQQVMPIFQKLKIPTEAFEALTEDQLNEQNLNIFDGELDKQWEYHSLSGGGVYRTNNRDGSFEMMREPTEKPPGNYVRGPDGEWMLNPLVGQAAAARRAPKGPGSGTVKVRVLGATLGSEYE